jgi:hypothetical protein
LKCSKGDGGQNCLIEVRFRRENVESFGQKSLRSASGGHNSPWRTREVARTVRSRGAVRWLGVGRICHPDIKNQCESLIVISLSHHHFGNSGSVSLECKPKSLVTLKPESQKGESSVKFRYFEVRHTGNFDDKGSGPLALKPPKSRNATCL